MEPVLIGLGFKARHGKDTAAAAIIEARGHEFDIRRYAFADELKIEVEKAAELVGGMFALYQHIIGANPSAGITWDPNPDMTDPLCPSGKQRSILQWWGTEHRRNKDAFYWVKKIKSRIEAERPQIAIITDVRFPNEFLYVGSTGGTTIRIEREGFGGIELSDHVSENILAGWIWDYEIRVPEGGLDELKKDAVSLFDQIVAGINSAEELLEVGC